MKLTKQSTTRELNGNARALAPTMRAFHQPITASNGMPRRPPPRQQPSPGPRPSNRYSGGVPSPSPTTQPPPRRAPPSSDDNVYLPRSLIMDKEVITRTSGKRLGYVNQLYVDPTTLEVISVYLRQGITSIGASNTDHVLISSLRQIGDVVLVHDEGALLDPPADETYGYIRLVGTEVQTEDGISLGKVRDFVFNPDNGQIVSIRYDALGLPSIPQSLLSCYTLGWQDIIAVGPTKTIVRRGSDRRAVKENDGWISEYVTALIKAVAGAEEEGSALGPAGTEAYRGDPAYAEWYALHAAEYERYYGQRLPKPINAEAPRQVPQQRQQQPPPQQQQVRRRPQGAPRQPMALPPPQSTSYRQALQEDQRWQQQQQQEYEMVGGGPSKQRQYAGGQPGQQDSMRRTRQPPPFANRQDNMPPAQPRTPPGQQQQSTSYDGPPPSRPRPGTPPARPQQIDRSSSGPQTGPGAAGPRASAAPLPVEPDAVISGGYKPRVSSRQPADFAAREVAPPNED